MKILLFTTSIENVSKNEGSYPLGIAYIGAVLEKKGHQVKAFDFLFENWETAFQKAKEILISEKPDVIGISSMTTNRTSSFQLAILAKKLYPDVKIVMGGVHPTLMYKQILENFPVDFIVLGEGEETMSELVDFIKKKKDISKFKKVKGIAFKLDNEIIKTEARPFLMNLDKLPMPNHLYFKDKIEKGKIFYLIISRGCPYACTFCSTSLHWGRMARRRSPKKVIEEIRFLKKEFPDVNYAIFNDDEFLINHDWVRKFCSLLTEEKINLKWACAARVTSITEEIIKLIKSAGCDRISLGLESASPKMLKYMNKCITLEQVSKAFNICKKFNLQTNIFLMVGLPGEDSKTINETIEFTKKLSMSKVMYLPSVYHVFPGTQTYELAKKQGFISDDYWLTEKTAPFYTYENSKLKLIYWAFKIAFFHNLHNGKLLIFLSALLKANLRFDQFRRVVRRYLM
jgi:magnesium-protoporphyrin IX monomethyl ester (oxidative) cyclase